MSAQRHGGDGKLSEQQGQVEMEPTGSSSWRRQDSNDIVSQSHQTLKKKSKVEENDEDLFTVPDVEARPALNSSINNNVQGGNNQDSDNLQLGISGKRRRGRNPVDKEYKRLKRLLRNRVSAQQARERKKVYVNELEARARELQDQNSKLEEKISTLTNENMMLRKILMNTRPKVDESIDQKKQQQ